MVSTPLTLPAAAKVPVSVSFAITSPFRTAPATSLPLAENVPFADVHSLMFDVMTKSKAKYGEDYPIAGGDGVHPGPNGHLVIAYAFLKALGCDGNVGTITVDLAGNKAEATDGHKVLSVKGGVVEIESTRYPFCFFGDGRLGLAGPVAPSLAVGIRGIAPPLKKLIQHNSTWGRASS